MTELTDKINEERIKAFVDAYGELVKKHDIDFAPVVELVPNRNGTWEVRTKNVPIDLRGRDIKDKPKWFR